MNSDQFPSGPWTGYYNYQPGQRHRMDMHLTFVNGQMSGVGSDDVGRFTLRGHYDATANECWWTKTYPGSHDVAYRGFREGRGIWGTWEIKVFTHGGFHIWPKEVGEDETGQRSAVMYTLIANRRLHGVEPYAYLKDVLARLPRTKNKEVAQLTPRQWKQAREQALCKAA